MTTQSARPDGDEPSVVRLGDDRRLAYAEYGDPAGEPVLFLHGTPGSRRLGGLLDAAAAELELRVIAPDRPGYGASSPWPERSVRDGGSVVGAVLDDAGAETASIVAFSGGCPHALGAAATRTERVDRVDVVSGASPPECRERTPPVQRLLEGLATTAPFALRGLFRAQARLAARRDPSFVVDLYTTDRDAESVPDDAAALVRADFLEAFARTRRGAVTEFRTAATGWELDGGAVETPVRFWHGTADANAPIGGVRRLASRLPDGRVTALDGADHLGALLRSAPDVLAKHRSAEA